jgi:hypothetical protein
MLRRRPPRLRTRWQRAGVARGARRRTEPRRWLTKAATRPLRLPELKGWAGLPRWRARPGELRCRAEIPIPGFPGVGWRRRDEVDGRTQGTFPRRGSGFGFGSRRLVVGLLGAGPSELSPQFVIAVGHCESPHRSHVMRVPTPFPVSTTPGRSRRRAGATTAPMPSANTFGHARVRVLDGGKGSEGLSRKGSETGDTSRCANRRSHLSRAGPGVTSD